MSKKRDKLIEELQSEFPVLIIDKSMDEEKTKYPMDEERTTYQKVTKVIGEIGMIIFFFGAMIRFLIEYFKGERGIIITTLLTCLCLWLLCETYDIMRNITYKEYFEKRKKRKEIKKCP